jgi:predicted enzyme related to lactoylglutathione lyase
MPYFQVADVDKSAARGEDLGGRVMLPPADIPNTGRFAILSDPHGASFALLAVGSQ